MSNVAVECGVNGQQGICSIVENQTTTISAVSASIQTPTSSVSPTPTLAPTSISTTFQTPFTSGISSLKPSTIIVTITTPLISASTSDTASNDSTQQPSDIRVVAITIGVVGGLAILIPLLYWAANYFANRRDQDQEGRDLEEEVAVSMLSPTLKDHRPAPLPGRPILSRPKRVSLLPYARKAVAFERQPRSSYNSINNNNSKRFSDLLARRVSAVHPGTRVLFGSPASKASKLVPARKPVPRKTGQPKFDAASGTESLYSDDADDVSTVLGGTNKSQRNEDTFHPMPPGVSFVKWLNAGRAQELPVTGSSPGSSKRHQEFP